MLGPVWERTSFSLNYPLYYGFVTERNCFSRQLALKRDATGFCTAAWTRNGLERHFQRKIVKPPHSPPPLSGTQRKPPNHSQSFEPAAHPNAAVCAQRQTVLHAFQKRGSQNRFSAGIGP